MTPPDGSWRRTNLGHLLFAAAGVCIADKLAVVHDAGFTDVTDAQLAVFRHLDPSGARLTTLAERAAMTKQAMIELVDRAERQLLITRAPDTIDRRAKMVVPTEHGLDLREAVERGIMRAEQRFVDAVGTGNLDAIQRRLGSSDGIERMLIDQGRTFVRAVLGNVHRRGYLAVTEALLALFRTLELGGSRLTEVAASGRITKQSMRLLVGRAERLGMVERSPDPADKRAWTISFTGAGLAMLGEMRRGVAEAEAAFAEAHDTAFLCDLKAWLTQYLAAT